MKTRACISGLLLCAVMLAATVAQGATVTLKNDTWNGSSATMALQLGVVKNERFGGIFKPTSYPFKISKVQVYIAHATGKSATTKKYTLEIYNDKTIAVKPGTSLYKQDVNITSSLTAIGEVDVSAKGISIPSGYVRVALTQHHDNAPSIVRDMGPIKTKRNLIYGHVPLFLPWGWYWSEDFKLVGNWIIRVVGETGTATPDMGTPDQKVTTPDQKVTPKDQKVTQQDLTASPDQTSTKKDGGVTKKDGGGPATGSEGGACFPNDTCNAGLSCLSKLCVKAPEPESSSGCSVGPADLGDPRLLLLLALVGATVLLRRRRR